MNILVTGGAGYIGSHTCVELLNHNHTVIIADNLCNSSIDAIKAIEQLSGKKVVFYQIDVTDEDAVTTLFNHHQFDGVIHFAGFKAVGESVSIPLDYYQNNLLSTIVLAKVCLAYGVNRFVFSSSATVYGDQESPLKEEMELKRTTNPYGETKAMSERILSDAAKANPEFAVSLLRYFNPVGAHPSGKLGERPIGIPNNLMPYVSQVAKGLLKQLKVYGNDYPTFDGTGVRDYIHVVDLAIGHVYAIEKIKPTVSIYNLGTGQGTSVLGIINTFKDVNQVDVPYEIVNRRDGDIAICYADASKACKELGWKTTKTIQDMVKDAWNYEKNN